MGRGGVLARRVDGGWNICVDAGSGAGELWSFSVNYLSAEQYRQLEDYLKGFGTAHMELGRRWVEESAVGALERYQRGVGFRAEVTDLQIFRVKLRCIGGGWEGQCSECGGTHCAHRCAVALRVELEYRPAGKKVSEEKKSEMEVGVKREEGTKVEILFEDRLGRRLSVEERRVAVAVDKIFKDHRDAGYLTESVLEPITGMRASWNWNSVQIWDRSPRTPWEAWLFLAFYLSKIDHRCPPAFIEVTRVEEIEQLTADWERREAVEKWASWLRDLAERPNAEVEGLVCLRIRLTEKGLQLESSKVEGGEFSEIKASAFTKLVSAGHRGHLPVAESSLALWQAYYTGFESRAFRAFEEPDTVRVLNQVLRQPGFAGQVVGVSGRVLECFEERLEWRVEVDGEERVNYRLELVLPGGKTPPPALLVVDGTTSIYLTREGFYWGPPIGRLTPEKGKMIVPAEALETSEGLGLLDRLGVEPPARMRRRVQTVVLRTIFRCSLRKDVSGGGEQLVVEIDAENSDGEVISSYEFNQWTSWEQASREADVLIRLDRRGMEKVPDLVDLLRVNWDSRRLVWGRTLTKHFVTQFAEWLELVPKEIEVKLDGELESIREEPVEAKVKLEVEEAGIDWFDLRVALDVADTTLTSAELKSLLDARGGYVRIGEKGWKRLRFQLSEEDEKQLADLGLDARDFSSEPQRLHALQLAGKKAAKRMLSEPQAVAIERRAMEIQTRVRPDLPAGMMAELRPYQLEGFHFLAYLSTNHFGGILADDMGLGKTVQALAWILWLKAQPEEKTRASLVVCPKSVTDNWVAEGGKFAPGLVVEVIPRGVGAAEAVKLARGGADIVVINYAQLRSLEKVLVAGPWMAVILDEAQYIKNPDSQTAKAAWGLRSAHRLALSGTPIENRLLDLWSIMGFAMPGVLGRRAAFAKSFDQRSDPFARNRLAARVRPFVLRRTKKEVAKDLPERTEEDLHCEMEGEQATIYRAELKRARAALLNIKTSKELDKNRFNILTSLLRLRQICCHQALVTGKRESMESAKLTALFDLLEPIIEEGHKVLVFSQFIEMLEIIRAEIEKRKWSHFILTGGTEDRGKLVREFQESEGGGVFLISLRAGGFGLNLTAASYVVLYDPWWNPAVENQAIDRTHRIGQTRQVFAYRLIIKESIEEKIRKLQQSKSALAEDILGEESFTRALSLDDFRFLLGD